MAYLSRPFSGLKFLHPDKGALLDVLDAANLKMDLGRMLELDVLEIPGSSIIGVLGLRELHETPLLHAVEDLLPLLMVLLHENTLKHSKGITTHSFSPS